MNKITISSKPLKAALDKALTCVNVASSITPICEFVKLTTEGGNTCMHITDLKNFIATDLAFEYDAPGTLLISHIELNKYLALIGDIPLTIERSSKQSVVTITAGDDIAEIPIEKEDAFPKLNFIDCELIRL